MVSCGLESFFVDEGQLFDLIGDIFCVPEIRFKIFFGLRIVRTRRTSKRRSNYYVAVFVFYVGFAILLKLGY